MRRSRINPRNQTRAELAFARNYGGEAARVRLMPCAVASSRCHGKIEVAHHPSRGASGGRFDIGPLCVWHHAEQGRGVLTFEASHGIDLRARWDEIALGHPQPLGLRGLARRWSDRPAELDYYETDALVGWTRREVHRAPWDAPSVTPFMDLDELGGEADGDRPVDAAGWVAARLDVPLECAQALAETAA